MNESIPNLRLLDDSDTFKELDLASELFHRINRIIPQDQEVLKIPPKTPVREAVGLMCQHGYSQIPVIENGEVIGVFSFRSFARDTANATLMEINNQKCAPGDLRVDEYLESFDFARVTEELSRVFDAMDRDDAILVGTAEHLVGILTPMDFLRYLYAVASPYVMVSEIELALRALIRIALSEEEIAEAARRSLPSRYGGEEGVPSSLEDMAFEDLRLLVSHSDTWSRFEPIVGGNRARTAGKLKEVRDIRNAIFHFKREITIEDHETLTTVRNWLLAKVKQVKAPPRKGGRE